MPRDTPPEVERTAHGLRLRDTQLHLEPVGRPPLGFLAHARGARSVLPERLVATAQTLALLEAAQPRALKKSAALPASYRSHFALGNLGLEVHPAGHVLGSAQLSCELHGRTIVYAGDLGGDGDTAPGIPEPRAQLECDTLILHATYGHPRYRFPPRREVLRALGAFVKTTLAAHATPILLAGPVGAAQEIARHLGEEGHSLKLHPQAMRAALVHVALGVPLPGIAPLAGKPGKDDVVILPHTLRHERLMRFIFTLGAHRVCLVSGYALDESTRSLVHEALPLSDHAGFQSLVDYALKSEATRVLTVHGHAEELAAALRAKGKDAQALREHHRQLELPGL